MLNKPLTRISKRGYLVLKAYILISTCQYKIAGSVKDTYIFVKIFFP
jgi:hypothetical protein